MFVGAILLLILRFMLAAENKKRDAGPSDTTFDEVYLSGPVDDSSSTSSLKKVDKVRYPHRTAMVFLTGLCRNSLT